MQTTDTLDGLLYKVTSMFTDLNNTISAMTLEKSTLNNVIDDLNNKITDITLEKLQLNNVIDDLNKKIIASNFKYDNDIELLSNKLTVKQEEFNDLKKVSYITSINKQLSEKNNYIKILEGQLEKLKKTSHYIEKIELTPEIKVEEIKVEEIVEEIKVEEIKVKTKKVKKSKTKKESNVELDNQFDPDMFEDINGFELLIYKQKYYLRDLETSEIYDIVDNKQNQIVGLINSKGKIKLK
jgi:desulfoferrodoxin (superoxide reductase-like protein)